MDDITSTVHSNLGENFENLGSDNTLTDIEIAPIRPDQHKDFVLFMKSHHRYPFDSKSHLSLFYLANPELCLIANYKGKIIGMHGLCFKHL